MLEDSFEQLLSAVSSSEKRDESTFNFKPEDLEFAARQEKSYEERKRETRLHRYEQDTNHRNGLVVWAATLVSLWLLCVIIILTRNTNEYQLSENIVIALLTTTTINVLGLMIIVLNDLFKGKSKNKKAES
ncbi:hypothetical protein ACFPVY_03925 [Flavobacterium qiangtangense]|uniref:Uncharacterized protein n=1 Tax=Flavobacterium qiangtangense TaxID=1442595 RepID=A0ABW1PJN5_9FLAO